MLTIPLGRLVDLLDKAAEVDLPEVARVKNGDGMDARSMDALEEFLTDDPAFGDLLDAIDRLTPEETEEVLALSRLARNTASLDEWQAMLEQAKGLPDEDAPGELLRILLLADDLELALERLADLADEAPEESAEADEEAEDPEKEGEGQEP